MAHKQSSISNRTGNYTFVVWTLTIFLSLLIILNPIIVVIAEDVHSLRGVLIWNTILAVFTIAVTHPLAAYLRALKTSRSDPTLSTNSKILPRTWTLSPRPAPAYAVCSILAVLWVTAVVPLCYLLAQHPAVVSSADGFNDSSSDTDDGSSVRSNSDPSCIGICRRVEVDALIGAGAHISDNLAIASAVLGSFFAIAYGLLAVDLAVALRHLERRRQGPYDVLSKDNGGLKLRAEDHLLSEI